MFLLVGLKRHKYLLESSEAFGAPGVRGIPAALLQVPHRGRWSGVMGPRNIKRGRAAQRADLMQSDSAEAEDGVTGGVWLRNVDALIHQCRLQ